MESIENYVKNLTSIMNTTTTTQKHPWPGNITAFFGGKCCKQHTTWYHIYRRERENKRGEKARESAHLPTVTLGATPQLCILEIWKIKIMTVNTKHTTIPVPRKVSEITWLIITLQSCYWYQLAPQNHHTTGCGDLLAGRPLGSLLALTPEQHMPILLMQGNIIERNN